MAKGHRCCTRTRIPCHCNFRRSHPICYGCVDKSSHPLKQNFNQLPLWELLFCPGVSSLLILLKCKLFGVEAEAICLWLSVSAFMAPPYFDVSNVCVGNTEEEGVKWRQWDLIVDYFLLGVTVEQFQCHCGCGWTDPCLALQDLIVAVCSVGLSPTLGSILEP